MKDGALLLMISAPRRRSGLLITGIPSHGGTGSGAPGQGAPPVALASSKMTAVPPTTSDLSIYQAPIVRAAPVARAALWCTSCAMAVCALLLMICAPHRRSGLRITSTPSHRGPGIGAHGLGATQVALPSSEMTAVPPTQ